jgi:magnesium chelatase family protein
LSLATVYSRGLAGLQAPLVSVEVHLGPGLPGFAIVGLPETEVREARDRVRAALAECGYALPQRRITVNLAPADLPKESGRFDLAIALGILAASGQLAPAPLERYEFVGELALSGALRPVRGALAMTFGAVAAGRQFVLPRVNAPEAALVRNATVLPADSLLQVCQHLRDGGTIRPFEPTTPDSPGHAEDLADVVGQAHARRALEVAAAGGHALLMTGPPGTGKSMLARRLPGLLPPLSDVEAIESAAIQSLGSGGFQAERWRARPFRAPHHSASSIALVGGGNPPRPGEISLAHHGVLFLDELPEFDRRVLEMLREPLESGRVALSRAGRQCEFPARFQLIAAMNPCPCGYLGHPRLRCRCTAERIDRYRARVSGPLLDRIDMRIDVPAVDGDNLVSPARTETSATVRERVEVAIERQVQRQGIRNAWLSAAGIAAHCELPQEGRRLLQRALQQLQLSARGLHRVLRVARTVADLAGSRAIAEIHLAEAIHYRRHAGPGDPAQDASGTATTDPAGIAA